MFNIPKDFWKKMETDKNFFHYVIYGDTDSMYINIPEIKPKTTEEAITAANTISKEINDIITDFTNEIILKKLNVDKKYNHTDYKTELVASSILLMDIKKNYAYKIIAEKGKVFKNPKIEYKGIPVVRVDYSKFTQDLIRTLIDDIVLSPDDENANTIDKLRKLLQEKQLLLKKCISELNIEYIGSPGKWSLSNEYKLEPYHLTAMRLYNSITETETFKEGTSGYSLPVVLEVQSKINMKINSIGKNSYYLDPNTPISKLTYLTLPYHVNKNKLLKLMSDFDISLDFEVLWDKLFSKSAQRICEIIKSNF